MYVNGELKGESKGRYYPTQKEFDINSIGCEIDANSRTPKNSFRGEMSALYFLEVNSHNLGFSHNLINHIYVSINMSELIALATAGTAQLPFCSRQNLHASPEQLAELSLLERIYLVANPKWAKGQCESSESICILPQSGKQKNEIYNHVEKILPHTLIHHNTIARNVFVNIGSIKTFLPLLFELGERFPSQNKNSFAYYIPIDNNII